jgi:hypothetical protein
MGDHIFICYARRDEDFVLKLAANLKERGGPVWLDQARASAGSDHRRTVRTGLDAYQCSPASPRLDPNRH